jgi:hypothetical protein
VKPNTVIKKRKDQKLSIVLLCMILAKFSGTADFVGRECKPGTEVKEQKVPKN